MNWTDRGLVSIRPVQGKRFASPVILILFFVLIFLPAIVSAQSAGGGGFRGSFSWLGLGKGLVCL